MMPDVQERPQFRMRLQVRGELANVPKASKTGGDVTFLLSVPPPWKLDQSGRPNRCSTVLVSAFGEPGDMLVRSRVEVGDPLSLDGPCWMGQGGTLLMRAETIGYDITEEPLPFEAD